MNRNTLGETLMSSLQENIELFGSLGEEVRFQAKTTLQSQLEKMDLVTREEFDATSASLQRAMQRIEELEAKIAEST